MRDLWPPHIYRKPLSRQIEPCGLSPAIHSENDRSGFFFEQNTQSRVQLLYWIFPQNKFVHSEEIVSVALQYALTLHVLLDVIAVVIQLVHPIFPVLKVIFKPIVFNQDDFIFPLVAENHQEVHAIAWNISAQNLLEIFADLELRDDFNFLGIISVESSLLDVAQQ